MVIAEDEDEDLKRALTLSLQETSPGGPSRNNNTSELIDLTADQWSDGSISQSERGNVRGPTVTLSHGPSNAAPSEPSKGLFPVSSMLPYSNSGILGLDRKAMEEERLARIAAKRKAPDSPTLQLQNEERAAKIPKTEVLTVKRSEARVPSAFDAKPKLSQMTTQNGAINGEANASTSKTRGSSDTVGKQAQNQLLQYPYGVVKKTWALGHDRGNDIKIEEVLQKADLNVAVLSAFQWDVEWIFSKLNIAHTKLILVMQAKDQETRDRLTDDTADMPNVRLCFPSMEGQINCMHSKLMLLFHTDYLRVVIPSANLVKYDWGETGVMENSVFIIDLPRFTDEKQASSQVLTDFGKELMYFIDSMGLQEEAKNGVLRFDFASTAHLAFIHTIGGAHSGEGSKRTGLPGLSRAVRQLDLQTYSAPQVDFCASSIGSLNDSFLQTVYSAIQGEDSHAVLSKSGSKDKTNTSTVQGNSRLAKFTRKAFRIYFVTHETVAHSTGGVENAGTICLSSKWYDAEAFPREMMRDYKSKRRGLLSHNKILYVRSPPSAANPSPIAWAYVGSANLSESAWGKLVIDRSTKAPKLNCRNWECGVLMKVPPSEIKSLDTPTGVPTMDAFNGFVDVPFEFPGEEYEDRRPWFFRG